MRMQGKLALASNAFVAVMTAVACFMTAAGWGAENGVLSSVGMENLKYFTVLSNVFSGTVSACFTVMMARGVKLTYGWMALKLAAVTSVAITFLTVVVLFKMVFGLEHMFEGANFWFHLVLPLVTMVEFCLLDDCGGMRLHSTAIAALPTLLYGIAYYVNILVNGMGTPEHPNDWYGFMSWGSAFAPVVFAIMVFLAWVVSLGLWSLNNRWGSAR